MNAARLRENLLAQHDQLRRLLAAAVELADRLVAGEPVQSDLRGVLDDLVAAFRAHNWSEEAALGPLLAQGDEVAPQRVARMLEEHVAEHEALVTLLSEHELTVAPKLGDIAEELGAHMDAEERTFLHPAVIERASRS